jgi:glycosyltransferase involved in cell wall biosynthesis
VRILYLADIRFPIERANGIQTMETAHALAVLGQDVTLGVRPDVRSPPGDPFEFYGLAPVDRLRFQRAPIAGPFALRRWQYLAWALPLASRHRFDAVMTRDLGVASAVLRLPGWQRPPVVFESHGFAPVFAATIDELVPGATRATAAKVARLERRERLVWTRANGYISTTQVLIDDLSQRWGARANVAVIPNGVRLDANRRFSAPTRDATPIVAYAGHLYPWKGSDVFVEALSRLPGARGLIVGGHPEERDWGRVQALSDRLGLAGRLTFAGFVPVGDVTAALATAAVVIVPTTATPSARYTSPLKMFEYMSTGRAIVASDLPSIREVLRHEDNALLVAPGDPQAMAAAIDRLLRDPALAERLARQAFADVGEYAWDRRASKVLRVIEAAAER